MAAWGYKFCLLVLKVSLTRSETFNTLSSMPVSLYWLKIWEKIY